ncbi:hypothetical protein Pfo_002712 [Paulownia fortunei]|nr:hypothetical protein Pfo_002712 [Paulownia fortunei]
MSYDDVEIEDMEWSEELQAFTYPCPCGDLFQITKEELRIGEEIARCPSCSLYITVIYNMEDFQEKSSKKMERAKPQPLAPDTNSVFLDVSDDVKKDILFHHSEKLAIAFGLMRTKPGTIIRITKNLRICNDCHSASKFISKGKERTKLSLMTLATMVGQIIFLIMTMTIPVHAGDTNPVFDPCSDAKVQRLDGFTFGLAFSSKNSFFFNQTQLSPCDRRLSLSGNNAELAVFRPKVDEISLLTINSSTFNPSKSGGYMVAFAGRQYAARSIPVFVADNSHTITSFTLVLEFQKGTLQNLFWKKFGCGSCTGGSFVCLNNTDCAVPNSKCKGNGGSIGCDLGVQLAFSGTDKNDNVLNSWYEVANLRQYSLYALYSNLRNSLTSPFQNLF